jgi:hypothetical protein
MEHLKETQIRENSFIMIEFENGEKRPFFVFKKKLGPVSKAIMILGLEGSLTAPLIPGWAFNLHYIATDGEDGKEKKVSGYRPLRKIEKELLKKVINTVGTELEKLI